MRRMSLLTGGIALAVMAFGSVAKADPAPGTVHVLDAKIVGNGCPRGLTAKIDLGNALVLAFNDNFTAAVGRDAGGKVLDRKACTIQLLLDVPAGYTYSLASFHTLGTAALAPGARGQHQTKYWFQGTSSTAYYASFIGSGDWWIDDSFSTPVYSACGEQRYLNITTSLTALAGTSNPATTTSSITEDFAFATTYDLDFQPCP
jgi:hypothetical protein